MRMRPYLKSRVHASRYLWAPLLITVGAVFISLEIYFKCIARGGLFSLGLPFIWIGWFQSRRSSHWAARANWVLETIPAVPIRVSFEAGEGGPSAKLVSVSNEQNRQIDLAAPSREIHRYEGTVVQVHADPNIDDLVIIRTNSGILWPLDQYRRIPPALRIDAKGAKSRRGHRKRLSVAASTGVRQFKPSVKY